MIFYRVLSGSVNTTVFGLGSLSEGYMSTVNSK